MRVGSSGSASCQVHHLCRRYWQIISALSFTLYFVAALAHHSRRTVLYRLHQCSSAHFTNKTQIGSTLGLAIPLAPIHLSLLLALLRFAERAHALLQQRINLHQQAATMDEQLIFGLTAKKCNLGNDMELLCSYLPLHAMLQPTTT